MGRINNIILLGIVAVIFAVIEYYVPLQADDLVFTKWYIDFLPSSNIEFSIGAYLNYIIKFWNDENGRLANMLFPLFGVIIPKWLFSIIFGLCVASIIYLITVISIGKNRLTYSKLLISVLLCTFLLPWRDNILVLDFALNYVFTSVLILYVIYIYKSLLDEGAINRNVSWYNILIFFFAGMMHEGFSVPLSVGITVVFVTHRRMLKNKGYIILSLAFLFGTLVCVSSPAIFDRAANTFFKHSIGMIGGYLIKSIIIISVIILLFYNYLKRRVIFELWIYKPYNLMIVICMFVSFIIGFNILIGHRIIWCGNLMAIIIIQAFWYWNFVKKTILKKILVAICSVFMGFFFYNVIICQIKAHRQFHDIFEMYKKSINGTVYYDFVDYNPIKYWGYTTYGCWRNKFHYNFFALLWGKRIGVVPTVLKNIDIMDSDVVNGNTGGISRIGDVLFWKADENFYNQMSSHIKYGDVYAFETSLLLERDGHCSNVKFTFIPFLSENNILYYYIVFTHYFDKTDIDALFIKKMKMR